MAKKNAVYTVLSPTLVTAGFLGWSEHRSALLSSLFICNRMSQTLFSDRTSFLEILGVQVFYQFCQLSHILQRKLC